MVISYFEALLIWFIVSFLRSNDGADAQFLLKRETSTTEPVGLFQISFWQFIEMCVKRDFLLHIIRLWSILVMQILYFFGLNFTFSSGQKTSYWFKFRFWKNENLSSEKMKRENVIVIGGGFFGLYLACFLNQCGFKISLFEAESEYMTHASLHNQARVHQGYHYPRSVLTALPVSYTHLTLPTNSRG